MKFEENIKNKYLYRYGFNFFKLFYFFYQFLKTKKNLKKRIFYSNWGLDVLAYDFFKNVKNGIYIDVGCHQPFLNNNTYKLYKKGWVGINIDLDFNTIDMFNFFRKRDLNIQAAISDKEEERDLFFFHNRSAINTLSHESGTKAKEIRKINTKSLNSIIENSKFRDKKINFVSIDVEGFELNVLKGFNLKKYKPDLIMIEFIDLKMKEYYFQNIVNILDSTIYKFMDKNDYKMINWVRDDLVFVPKNIGKL